PEKHPDRRTWQSRVVNLLDQAVLPCVPQQTVGVCPDVAITFSWVPPGSFLMGSPPGEARRAEVESETRRLVTLTAGFFLGIYPLAQAQWGAVMDDNPSRFRGDHYPVEDLSWDDCQEFCRRLGEHTGKRFRLPAEAEWEYACRAGTTTPFFVGET